MDKMKDKKLRIQLKVTLLHENHKTTIEYKLNKCKYL